MQGNNIKAPNPTKNQLLDLARTQSAPPEGKEGELGDLINKLPKNNNSNQQALNNAASSQTKEKVLSSFLFLIYFDFVLNRNSISKPNRFLQHLNQLGPHPQQ